MGILRKGLREVLHNFTSQISDINAPNVEISTDNFVAIARKSGMSQEDIAELLKNRNGVEVKIKRTKNIGKNIEVKEQSEAAKSQTMEKEESEIELDR